MKNRRPTRISQPRKEASHQRILHSASRAIRRHGYDGVSVAAIMKEAGLTHGGFYAHFESREDMLACAADAAGAQSVASLEQVAAHAKPGREFESLIAGYLSSAHLDNVESGCPVAALGSEMPRQSPEVRHAATQRLRDMIALIERVALRSGDPIEKQEALGVAATMVGALMMARAVDDARLARDILNAAKARLIAH